MHMDSLSVRRFSTAHNVAPILAKQMNVNYVNPIGEKEELSFVHDKIKLVLNISHSKQPLISAYNIMYPVGQRYVAIHTGDGHQNKVTPIKL